MCTRPFSQIIWFIYSFFILCTTIRPKIRVLINLFICARPFDQKLGSSLINLFHLYTTIRPKIRVRINLMFLYNTTIRPKIRVLINFFLFVHNHFHLTKVRSHCYSLIYSFLSQYFVCYVQGSTSFIFRSHCFWQ